MAKSNASTHKLYIVESTVAKLVAHVNDLDLAGSAEIIDFTTKDNNGYRDFQPGLLSNTLSVSGKADFQPGTDNRNIDDIITAWNSRTSIILLLKNATTGDTTHQGTAFVTAWNITSATETALEFTATFDFSGALTIGTVS